MTRQTTKISVLTCCYNAENFIEEAIESILHQSYEEFEYVLVNDGSTDNTLSILKRYVSKDKQIVLIEKKNTGLTDSLNVGFGQAKGEWIARLDADDVAMPERLSNQLNFVQDNDGVVLLGGGCIEVDKNGTATKKHVYPQEQKALMNRLENGKAFFPHSSAFFNKARVMELGGYNPKFTRSQDRDLWLRIGETARIACLQIPVVKLRKHFQMISNTNQGRLQSVMGLCASICHFRRKAGLSDLSQMEEDVWQGFLKWVEKRMEEEGFFQCSQGWQALRNVWYSNIELSKLEKGRLVLKELIQNPLARKAFWRRFRKENPALKLAEESKRIW
ncbi:Undecaprenyl-phosphate 4-deoxy-4-formamido-L-arabinose transferase [subsurface metagenome]